MNNNNINKAVESSLPSKKSRHVLSNADLVYVKRVSDVILTVVVGAGIITLAAVAPNIFVAIDGIAKMVKSKKGWSKEEKKAKVKRAFYYLKKSGMIKLNPSREGVKVEITDKGEDRIKKVALQTQRVKKINNWDGKWWLVAADIPTLQYRYAADLFRKKLKEMGFYTLQRTLWFYPFDPQKQIQFVSEHFGIEKYVTVMEVNRVDEEDEKNLKTFFQANAVL